MVLVFSGEHGSAVPKNFGRVGIKLEGCSPEQPNSFSVVREHDPPVKAKTAANGK
jgi:hypothetical protein